ncbi:MAG: hypothetical protein AAGH45_00345 [Pseudomonadota bacterium]
MIQSLLAALLSLWAAASAQSEEITAALIDGGGGIDGAGLMEDMQARGADLIASLNLDGTLAVAQRDQRIISAKAQGFEIAYSGQYGLGRVALAYDPAVLSFDRSFDLVSAMRRNCGQLNAADFQPPFVSQLRIRQTGRRFWVMVLNVPGDDPALDQCLSSALNSWSRENTIATILLAHFGAANPPLADAEAQAAYLSDIRADDVYRWVQPERGPVLCTDDLFQDLDDFLNPASQAGEARVRSALQLMKAGGGRQWQARASIGRLASACQSQGLSHEVLWATVDVR